MLETLLYALFSDIQHEVTCVIEISCWKKKYKILELINDPKNI